MKTIVKLLKFLVLSVVALVLLVLILGLFAKKEYTVSREITVNKPSTDVYNYISNLKNQNQYGVWYKRDTAMKQTFTGTDAAVGFKTVWESKSEGNGDQTITKIETGKAIETAMNIHTPFGKMSSNIKMSTEPTADSASKVTWLINGKTPYPFNAIGLFISMEDAMGKDFETGLINIKTILESKQ